MPKRIAAIARVTASEAIGGLRQDAGVSPRDLTSEISSSNARSRITRSKLHVHRPSTDHPWQGARRSSDQLLRIKEVKSNAYQGALCQAVAIGAALVTVDSTLLSRELELS